MMIVNAFNVVFPFWVFVDFVEDEDGFGGFRGDLIEFEGAEKGAWAF